MLRPARLEALVKPCFLAAIDFKVECSLQQHGRESQPCPQQKGGQLVELFCLCVFMVIVDLGCPEEGCSDLAMLQGTCGWHHNSRRQLTAPVIQEAGATIL